MKVIVIGATGHTSKLLIKKTLDKGHKVTAFDRTPHGVGMTYPNLELIKGDVYNLESIDNAIKEDHDVVICMLNVNSNKPTHLLSDGVTNLVSVMKRKKVKKIICLSSAGIMGNEMGFFFQKIVAPLLLNNVFDDRRRQLNILENSDLDYVLVRATQIVDKPYRGDYKVSLEKAEKPRITRGDLCEFIIKQIDDNTYLRKMPIVSN